MNYFDPKHPHEPEISPQFDVDGRCLICLMICKRDNAIRERDELMKDVRKLQDIKQKHEHEELVAAQENDRLKIKLDDAREALMKIEEIFIDGGDTYLDFVRVGNIAREFLERNKD